MTLEQITAADISVMTHVLLEGNRASNITLRHKYLVLRRYDVRTMLVRLKDMGMLEITEKQPGDRNQKFYRVTEKGCTIIHNMKNK